MFEKDLKTAETIPELTFEDCFRLVDTAWQSFFVRAGVKYESPFLEIVDGGNLYHYEPNSKVIRVGKDIDAFFSSLIKDVPETKRSPSLNAARFVVIAHEMGHHTQVMLGMGTILEDAYKKSRESPYSGELFFVREFERHADYLIGFMLRMLLEKKMVSITLESLLMMLGSLHSLGRQRSNTLSEYDLPEGRRNSIKEGFRGDRYFPADVFPEMAHYAFSFRKLNALIREMP